MKKLIDTRLEPGRIIFIGNEEEANNFKNNNYASNVHEFLIITDANEWDSVFIPPAKSEVNEEISFEKEIVNDSAEKKEMETNKVKTIFDFSIEENNDGSISFKSGAENVTLEKEEFDLLSKVVVVIFSQFTN